MKCDMCREEEAVNKITIGGYNGNIAAFRCEQCTDSAKNSYEEVDVVLLNGRNKESAE